jgi:glycosyltransferase involved in cell wall biosynthesis
MQLPPPIHGVTTMNQHVADSALLASHFEVDIIPLRFAASIDDLGKMSSRKLGRTIATGARLAWKLITHRPDAVYFTLSPSGGAFYRDCVFVAIIKSFAVPRIFHLHAKGVATHLNVRWKRALYQWAFRGSFVIQLSPYLRPDTAQVVDDDHVFYVPNGVTDHAGEPHRVADAGPPRILYLSNMIENKGPLVLLEALGALAARDVAFSATFVGARFHDGCLEAFEAMVARLGLGQHVRYLGPIYGAAKHELLREHDIFAFPTHEDAFPLVLLEAMQYGLPSVATLEGAIPEIVSDGETGFLVPRRDPESLARRLEQLLADSALRERMGRHSRERFLENYTLGHFERNLTNAVVTVMRSAGDPIKASDLRKQEPLHENR